MARGSALRGRLEGVLTLDFEGLTLDRGQLTPGAYGEGYADRRHPHTYLHEATASSRAEPLVAPGYHSPAARASCRSAPMIQ